MFYKGDTFITSFFFFFFFFFLVDDLINKPFPYFFISYTAMKKCFVYSDFGHNPTTTHIPYNSPLYVVKGKRGGGAGGRQKLCGRSRTYFTGYINFPLV